MGEIGRVKNFLIALFTGLIFSGCSITPRYHSFGYNVEWKTRVAQRSKPSASPLSTESQKRSRVEAREFVASHQSKPNTQSTTILQLRPSQKADTVPAGQVDTLPKNVLASLELDSTKQRIAEALAKNKRISRRTNYAIIGDALTIPLSLWLDLNVLSGDGITALLYSVLIAIPVLIVLLLMRLFQGVQKRSLINMDKGQRPRAVKKIEAAQVWAILALITSFTVLSTILFGIISTILFAQAEELGVDKEYYKKKRRITRTIYAFASIFPITIMIIAILI
jgi:hypothetical protein